MIVVEGVPVIIQAITFILALYFRYMSWSKTTVIYRDILFILLSLF
jgi:hypothetical protein